MPWKILLTIEILRDVKYAIYYNNSYSLGVVWYTTANSGSVVLWIIAGCLPSTAVMAVSALEPIVLGTTKPAARIFELCKACGNDCGCPRAGFGGYTILYYTILYYTILYYTILYYTILYYTILYYTILLNGFMAL